MDSNPQSPVLVGQERWLDHLRAHLSMAREGGDPEGVHQVRVAAARLDTWLWLGARTERRDALRQFRRTAGRLRDLDVLLAGTPPPAWVPWLTERRIAERLHFLEALDDPGLTRLLDGLGSLPGIDPLLVHRRTQRLRERVVERGRRLDRDPLELERCHDLRKAVRRLRYASEFAGEDARPIRALQKILGNLNDAAVALALTDEWAASARVEEPGIREYGDALRERLEAMRAAAVEAWRASELAVAHSI